MRQLTCGSLFAGIGGFDLGFERAGIKTIWQVEIDEFARGVLERRFPHAERFNDVRTCGKHNLLLVDVITGGFPCQDVSRANPKGAGLDGDRSGLWFEYYRIIREIRPRIVVVENVSALLADGMGRVLGGLAAIGYDCEWDCLPASAFGAYHERDRVFIVAHDASVYPPAWSVLEASPIWRSSLQLGRLYRMAVATRGERENGRLDGEPTVDRLVRGVSVELDGLKGYGNSVYPAIAEWLGQRILSAEEKLAEKL